MEASPFQTRLTNEKFGVFVTKGKILELRNTHYLKASAPHRTVKMNPTELATHRTVRIRKVLLLSCPFYNGTKGHVKKKKKKIYGSSTNLSTVALSESSFAFHASRRRDKNIAPPTPPRQGC